MVKPSDVRAVADLCRREAKGASCDDTKKALHSLARALDAAAETVPGAARPREAELIAESRA